MQIVECAKLFPAMAFRFANTPAWWDLSLGYLNCWREKKISFTFSVRTGLSLRVISGESHRNTCHHIWMVLQDAGTKCTHWSASQKPNEYFLKDTIYHPDDWHSWLNRFWKMKIFCILATVPTGGWNSGHLPNHQEVPHDWQATVYHIAHYNYNEL